MFIKEFKNTDKSYVLPDQSEYLANLRKLNVFVGENNSGKSRYLRSLFGGTVDDFVFYNDLNKKLKIIHDMLEPKFRDYFYMKDLKNLISSRTGEYISRFNSFYQIIEHKKSQNSGINGVEDLAVAREIKKEMLNQGIYQELTGQGSTNNIYIYIPILRGLRHIDLASDANSNKRDLYQEKTVKDYGFKSDIPGHSIFTGLSVYEEIKKMMLGSKQDRDFIKEFEEFLSANFFKGQPIKLISDHGSDNVMININDSKDDRAIFNVGDGIQSIIINTFEAFKYKGGTNEVIFFIEEPELTMHPSVQRILIETLINKFNNVQVFVTTHSNHFLDLTYDYSDDVSIFSFKKNLDDEKFYINNVTDNSVILDLLGIRNSSVFLSNCIIWTEGVTDRMLLKKLFEIYDGFRYKEDYNYSFAEYGGGNLENFDYIGSNDDNKVNVNSISKNNFLLIDNDLSTEVSEKYKRRQKIKEILTSAHVFDEHIEIENLVPYDVWVKAIDLLLKEEPGKQLQLKSGYESNKKKFDEKLNSIKIGKNLKKNIIELKDGKSLDYYENDGVQCLDASKKKIMSYVIKAIDELHLKLNDFPEVTQKLVKSLDEFISLSNK